MVGNDEERSLNFGGGGGKWKTEGEIAVSRKDGRDHNAKSKGMD